MKETKGKNKNSLIIRKETVTRKKRKQQQQDFSRIGTEQSNTEHKSLQSRIAESRAGRTERVNSADRGQKRIHKPKVADFALIKKGEHMDRRRKKKVARLLRITLVRPKSLQFTQYEKKNKG